uniref:Uncharacterized protein n=1 Tax=Glossina austeni TaxID=7395 RepID=A0A1A9US24_GLOAU
MVTATIKAKPLPTAAPNTAELTITMAALLSIITYDYKLNHLSARTPVERSRSAAQRIENPPTRFLTSNSNGDGSSIVKSAPSMVKKVQTSGNQLDTTSWSRAATDRINNMPNHMRQFWISVPEYPLRYNHKILKMYSPYANGHFHCHYGIIQLNYLCLRDVGVNAGVNQA